MSDINTYYQAHKAKYKQRYIKHRSKIVRPHKPIYWELIPVNTILKMQP
jgi:hypothetical protein